MSDCCSDYRCRRASPIEIRREAFSGQWVAVTKYRRREGTNGGPAMLDALQKHYLPPISQAIIELSGATLLTLGGYVKRRFQATTDDAYRDVLDKLTELTAAKEYELLGGSPLPRREQVDTEPMTLGQAMTIMNRWSDSTPDQQHAAAEEMADRLSGVWGWRYVEHLEREVADLRRRIAELTRAR